MKYNKKQVILLTYKVIHSIYTVLQQSSMIEFPFLDYDPGISPDRGGDAAIILFHSCRVEVDIVSVEITTSVDTTDLDLMGPDL